MREGYHTEKLPDGRVALFLDGKTARLRLDRTRQTQWDQKHYITLSTRTDRRTARRFRRACQRDGLTVYAALKAFVEEKARTMTTAPPGSGGV